MIYCVYLCISKSGKEDWIWFILLDLVFISGFGSDMMNDDWYCDFEILLEIQISTNYYNSTGK